MDVGWIGIEHAVLRHGLERVCRRAHVEPAVATAAPAPNVLAAEHGASMTGPERDGRRICEPDAVATALLRLVVALVVSRLGTPAQHAGLVENAPWPE